MFEWSETDEMIRESVRTFIDREIRPNIDDLEHGDLPPYGIMRKLFSEFGIDVMLGEQVEKMLAKQQAKADRIAAGEPEPEKKKRDGKSGGGPFGAQGSLAAVLVSELAGVSLGSVAAVGVSLGLGAATIASRGTLAQKRRWLKDIVTLDKIAAWAITEPDSGSDAFGGTKTYVRRDGEDYILNGQKTFITNGPYADLIVVYAKLDAGDQVDKRDRKVLTFVLDKGMEGLTQGRSFKKMGMHSSPTGELFFDNIRLSPDRLLGETEQHKGGDGRESARSSFTTERIGCAILSLGIINECHRLCVEYAKSRTLWGQEIATFQLIQLKLAEMEIARLNVQNMVFNALEAMAAGKTPSLAEASAMKLYSTKAATDVAMEAVQLFGGNGYMDEYRVEQLARDAKSLMIYAGSNEIQVTHVAKGLLAG
ncbi:acyl-CoA dehydrogenase family protein [Mycolicibacterium brumae]|uniref:Acyl-CoA dehydrogenase n=1 Tax=Mycolicibacterium brumae TaxID=85968 RepID=A0A2G5P5G4_9MYCO|nr:acyl-CoA dehydrogenase family protein [Mycolicibacterium brumae]MCV7191702.1 acyl-CoA/acyl-ACP dehydrogenase [Mycolicibacterium brumae]PIB73506.1 acyl-CoA dehydrogenase [Mycolicibacterium brumae]RWA20443.1 acyl-CoA dehydrogenase [Mycolicibacterium brumae DSM 44177]UWW07543.1 acyl-CoA/acyl-ACP dehydrogenase [Mycolicibacterium brumae]